MSVKIASLFAEIGIRDTLTPALQKSKQGLTDVKATLGAATVAVAAMTAAYYVASKAVDATVGEFVDLANSVRTLDQINGDSAENNSRLIQTLDDYKISTEEIITAQRKLATQGESMSIPTLMRLSDAYLQLNTGAERQAFLTENFGRNSAGWAEALAQGSAAIKAKNDAVAQGLILDEAALVKAREFELAMDDLSDAAQGVAVSIGQDLAPVLTKLATQYSEGVRLQQLYDKARELGIPITKNFITGQNQIYGTLVSNERLMRMVAEREEALARAAERAQTQIELEDGAFFRFNQTLEETPENLEAAAAAAQAMSDGFQDLNEWAGYYHQSTIDLAAAEADAETARLTYGVGSEQYQTAIDKVEELKQAGIVEKNQFVANALEKQFMITDGIDPIEQKFLDDYKLRTGLLNAEDIARAASVQAMVDYELAQLARLNGSSTWTVNVVTSTTIGGYIPAGQPGSTQSVPGAAGGADFVVPSGFPNDSFPLNVQSGEHVQVTPAGQSAPQSSGPVDLSNRTMDALARRMAAIMQMGAQ